MKRVNTNLTPCTAQVISNLLERQQRIISGKVKYVNKDNLIGVNVKALLDTVESVPYLTHLDYARAVRELTEFADFTVSAFSIFIMTYFNNIYINIIITLQQDAFIK